MTGERSDSYIPGHVLDSAVQPLALLHADVGQSDRDAGDAKLPGNNDTPSAAVHIWSRAAAYLLPGQLFPALRVTVDQPCLGKQTNFSSIQWIQ